ncbi:MAG: hypothetical protein IPL65_20560 [Lewinellaceae bacterium]|nr:hypothetical protein [Lewinellaceae bacterium]
MAPAKFLGPQCETYGKYFRWDQNINNSTNPLDPGGAPDLIFKGAGLTLAWDNPIDPGITWTHYDVLLQEDAGWRLNSNTGPPPTQAQFMAVLGNLTTIQIRGEYRYGADFGGLDNVILENSFAFDLDGDDSSGALNGNFNADSTCLPRAPLADVDAIFTSEKRVDSIVCQVQFAQNPALELLQSTVAANNIGVISSPGHITLYNLGGATLADFRQALLGLEYFDSSPMPFRGIRIVAVRVYTECGEAALRYAYLPIFPPADAGTDATVKLCQNDAAIDLRDALTVPFAPDGLWKPTLGSGSLFRPGVTAPGTYAYIVPPVGDCPGDTALIEVSVETLFNCAPIPYCVTKTPFGYPFLPTC